MKILFVCRLYSGFEESLQNGVWKPKGAPTIARMIEHLDASKDHELELIFTQKGASDTRYPSHVEIEGLALKLQVLRGHNHLPAWLGKFREKISDLYQAGQIIWAYHRIKPDIVYCDRVNIFPAALLARCTNARVIWRVMGVLEEMHQAVKSDHWRAALSRFMWGSPFKSVICTLDGSGGGPWMDHVLSNNTPRHLLLNGVNKNLKAEQINLLPHKGVKMLFVGRLEALKGIEEFMDAFYSAAETHKNLHAVIAGDGSLKSKLIEEAKNKGYADRVHFLGSISAPELKYIRQNTDFYVSLNKQGNLSNVNLEALSDHLPTIVPCSHTNKGIDIDTDKLVPDDVFYRFGTVGDTQALSNAISHLMDEKVRASYRQAAQKCAAHILPSWTTRIEQELQIYEDTKPYNFVLTIADLGSGGAQKVAVSLINDLNKAGKKIALITLKDNMSDFHKLPKNIKRITLEHCNEYKGIQANLLRIYKIRKALKDTGAKCVISFIAPTNILCVWAALGLNNRLIISERNDPTRQSFGQMWDKLRRLSYRFADIVTANSQNAVESLKAYVPEHKLYYVPNALTPPPKLNKQKDKTILIVGRLHEQKSHQTLLKAFAKVHQDHPDWTLIIAGEGPLDNQLKEQAEQLNIAGATKFTGVVKNPYSLYETASIFVLPSIHEGTPNALLEAMSCSCAPIISDACEGAMPFVKHEESGLIFKTGDYQQLADQLNSLISTPEKIVQYSTAAKEHTKPLYSRSTIEIWDDAINAKGQS